VQTQEGAITRRDAEKKTKYKALIDDGALFQSAVCETFGWGESLIKLFGRLPEKHAG
jgi:hypothetical protein